MSATPNCVIGQLADSQAVALLTAGANGATVSMIAFYNSHSADLTVSVNVKKSGGTSRQIISQVLSAGESYSPDVRGMNLGAGDLVYASAGTADKINYYIGYIAY
jgi:hypothetical protein